MKTLQKLLYVPLIVGILLISTTCGKDDSVPNEPPEVANPIPDFDIVETFETVDFDLEFVFLDPEGQTMTFTATSSDTGVVTVSVIDATLTITEVGLGSSTITVTATDPAGGTATDDFIITVE